jgi:hypothetical protein
MALKYGRKPRLYRPTIHYSALVAGTAQPSVPASVDYLSTMPDDLGMMGNAELGDCTCAAIAHARQVWSFNSGIGMRTTPDSDVISLYSTVSGYIPGNPSTDQGADEQTVLAYCKNIGAPIAPGAVNKLLGWVEVDVRNFSDIQASIYQGGLVYLGFNVPAYLESLEAPGSIWDVNPSADNSIIGGHAVIAPAYTPTDFGVVSWGSKYRMSQAFFSKFVDECYLLVDAAWLMWSGKTPAGLSVAELESLMESL